MKSKIIQTILLFTLTIASASAQMPDCDDLTVEEIYMDTPGVVAVTIRNTCYDCVYGGLGCVYNEMEIVRTVEPFDTMAASGCWCLNWHDPNTEGELKTYFLNTTLTGLPPVSEMEVKVTGCACDSIPFSPDLSSNEVSDSGNNIRLFPNPVKDIFYLTNISPGSKINIIDLSGKNVYTNEAKESKLQINISGLPQGIYFLTVSSNKVTKTFKLIKEP